MGEDGRDRKQREMTMFGASITRLRRRMRWRIVVGGGKRGEREWGIWRRGVSDRVLVSGSMLIEVENVLQTQEPVIRPAWNTFASSLSGIWKGVGAVFSPITAEMEPIDVGRNNQQQFDCYTLLHIEAVPSEYGVQQSKIQRRVNWVTLNPFGENKQLHRRGISAKEESTRGDASLYTNETLEGSKTNHLLPKFGSFDFETSDVMEEDVMAMEPGLVFFEDGSYSRGPVDIPVDTDKSLPSILTTQKSGIHHGDDLIGPPRLGSSTASIRWRLYKVNNEVKDHQGGPAKGKGPEVLLKEGIYPTLEQKKKNPHRLQV